MDRQALVIAVNVLGIVVSGGINLALLPHYGLVGAAAGAAAAQWVMGLTYVGVALLGRPCWDRVHAAVVSELPRRD